MDIERRLSLEKVTAKDIAEFIAQLLNRSLEELDGKFIISSSSADESTRIEVASEDNHILIRNFIPGLTKDYLEYLESVINNPAVKLSVKQGIPIMIISSSIDRKTVFGIIRKVYFVYSFDKPLEAKSVFGGFKIRFLGNTFSVVDSVSLVGDLFRENYISLPDQSGWFNTPLGPDNINLPLLTWSRNQDVYVYVPDERGNLTIFNVSELHKKLLDLLSRVGSPLEIRDPAQIFARISEIEDQIEIIEDSIRGSELPFANLQIQKDEKISELVREVKEGIAKIRKSISISKFLEQKLIFKKAIELARRILMGQVGVLSIATRKVSRLGAGYAVYISKEEAKLAQIKSKVTVKVLLEEDEKPKIIIQ